MDPLGWARDHLTNHVEFEISLHANLNILEFLIFTSTNTPTYSFQIIIINHWKQMISALPNQWVD